VPKTGEGLVIDRPRIARRVDGGHARRAPSLTPVLLQPIRSERLIALARVVLGGASILLLLLDPARPAHMLEPLAVLVSLYALLAVMVAVLAWRVSRVVSLAPRLFLHVLDLSFLTGIVSLTHAWTLNPFVLALIFVLAAAMIRWQRAGVLWTASAVLVLMAAHALSGVVGGAATMELRELAIRGIYLAVLTTLGAYFSSHDERLRRRLASLASIPALSLPTGGEARLRELLAQVARLLDAPRVVLAWQEMEHPQVTITAWMQGTTHQRVAAEEEATSLGLHDLSGEACLVLEMPPGEPGPRVLSAAGSRPAEENPLPDWLRKLGYPATALVNPLRGASGTGLLYVLDAAEATTDELVISELLGRWITVYMDQLALFRRWHRSGLAEERIRLARDLHDGVIQSLAAAAMRLEASRHLLRQPGAAAESVIDEVQELLRSEQQQLREIINSLQPERAPRNGLPLKQRLETMVAGLGRHWRLDVELDVRVPEKAVGDPLAREVSWLVREGLVNAVRHGRARHASAVVVIVDGVLRISVMDDGCGFGFRGRIDGMKLPDGQPGPFHLTQRVKSLGGQLEIVSGDAGATLEIGLPMRGARRVA
jgi:signal transduction histidine kinase